MEFDQLNTFTDKVEYAIHVESIESETEYTAWNKKVTMGATIIAGGNYAVGLAGLGNSLGYTTDLELAKSEGAVSIGIKDPFDVMIPFTDSEAPKIKSLQVAVGDIGATMNVMIDRPGTVYYVVAPVSVTGTDADGAVNGYTCPVVPDNNGVMPNLGDIKEAVEKPIKQEDMAELTQPFVITVTQGVAGTPGVLSGNTKQINANITKAIELEGLAPDTTYLVYMVTKGVSAVYSEKTLCAQFTTKEAECPIIDVTLTSSVSAEIEVDKSSYVSYALVRSDSLTGTSSSFSEDFSAAKGTANGDWAAASSKYSVKTVLDAMLTGYYENNEYKGSVFDKYGSNGAKDTYASLIRQTATESVMSAVMMQDEELFTVPNGADHFSKSVSMSGMVGQSWYTLLVVGRTLNSSGYAFRASRSYYNEDKEPLTAVVTLAAATDDLNATQKTCSGTLIIDFSDTLNYRIQNRNTGEVKYYPLDYCGLGNTKHLASDNIAADNGCKNIGSVVTTSPVGLQATIELSTMGNSDRHGARIGDILRFDLTKIQANSTVVVGQNICGSNGEVRENTSLTVIIKYDATTDTWSAEVKPDSWAP